MQGGLVTACPGICRVGSQQWMMEDGYRRLTTKGFFSPGRCCCLVFRLCSHFFSSEVLLPCFPPVFSSVLIQSGVAWFDIVMSTHYRHNLRRHLIKLHPRNDQITAVQCRCHFCIVTIDGLTKKLTEEYVRRNSHEFRHVVGQNGDWIVLIITNVTAALSVRLALSSFHVSSYLTVYQLD